MPIPKPQAGEKQSDYIQRCMEAIASEYTDKDQAVAICYTQWREGKEPSFLFKVYSISTIVLWVSMLCVHLGII